MIESLEKAKLALRDADTGGNGTSTAPPERPLWPLPPEGVDGLHSILAHLEETGESIGDFTVKTQARQTGVTLYLTFENKVDVMTTLEFTNQLVRSPALLADACRRLLARCGHSVNAHRIAS